MMRRSEVISASRHGMTLTEVAVSMAALVAVSTLLLPTLGEFQRQGKEMRCISNLKRITAASAIYAAADPAEMLIPVHPLIGTIGGAVGEYEWGGKSGVGESVSGSGSTGSRWGTQYGRGPASRRLNRIIYGDSLRDYQRDPGTNQSNWLNDWKLELDVFHCPADSGYTGHHMTAWRESGLSSYDHYGNSYVANTSWVGIAGGNCTLMSNSPFLRPFSRVPNPVNTVLYLENCGRFAWRRNYGSDGCSKLSGGIFGFDIESIVKGWHGRAWMFQVAFVDGHAGTIRINGHHVPQPDLSHYPPLGGQPTSYSNWHCITIRGSGWQMDTLPAPPVRTEIPCNSGVLINPIQ